jgi:integrase/recombinase XerC
MLVDLAQLSPIERAALVAQLSRETVRDKSYQLLPLGEDVAAYLRAKRKRLTDASYRGYESSLDKLARHFADLRVEDFEPPAGAARLEEFLDDKWGGSAPGTYNVNLSIISDFFVYWRKRGRLNGDPTLVIERARKREPRRATFTADQRHAMLAATELRDRIALRLLFDYGLRKGSLAAVEFRHFDHQRRRLTIFAKGGKVRELPLPDKHLWMDLERHILDVEAEPTDFLMCVVKPIPRVGLKRFPKRPMSSTALHMWWHRRLNDAGLVPKGATGTGRTMNMHAARHTAGQRVLDATGNLKAVQALLGHASIQTTGDTYVGWADEQLLASIALTLEADD